MNLHASVFKFRCLHIVLHHFQSSVQPNCQKHHSIATVPITCRKRSTCTQYARECIFPYPLLLRFPKTIQLNPVEATKAHTCCQYASIAVICSTSSEDLHTKSHLHTSCRCIAKYLCTRISPVFISIDCVHILIDVERNQKQCKNATLKLLHNEFPAVQLIAKEAQRFCREHSSQQIPGILHMQNKNSHILLHVVIRNHPHQSHANSRW